MARKSRKEVILGVTGSIAAYKACEIANDLKKKGYGVTVIMTKEAKHFIAPLTFQSLSGNKVFSEMFEPIEKYDPLHISLADRADLILISPCSANVIGKLANGICDDLLTCTVISSRAKVLIAPAMNTRMYKNKAVESNIAALKSAGYKFIGPIKGHLVCGEEGVGHLAKVGDILKEAKRLLQ